VIAKEVLDWDLAPLAFAERMLKVCAFEELGNEFVNSRLKPDSSTATGTFLRSLNFSLFMIVRSPKGV